MALFWVLLIAIERLLTIFNEFDYPNNAQPEHLTKIARNQQTSVRPASKILTAIGTSNFSRVMAGLQLNQSVLDGTFGLNCW
ncbi:hypothetical protein Haur_3620 [Herpetosiphon aurantiacus DSM 785]|uniref:Uncharacterized protein n=1 Tax=Herpetosiphon aurantiacus (strain ATCC 23779 / DSM 785 / 114-95) TaxID=316274 RepID=A9B645_HERA2|nr:hypothetical protein Haur_3620 [Herpetosiphon aurantiacus DSM 785]